MTSIMSLDFHFLVPESLYTKFGSDSLTKMKRLLQSCSSVAATMQQSNMYATTGGDKAANKSG